MLFMYIVNKTGQINTFHCGTSQFNIYYLIIPYYFIYFNLSSSTIQIAPYHLILSLKIPKLGMALIILYDLH